MRIASIILNFNSSNDAILLARSFLSNVQNSSVIIVDNNSDALQVEILENDLDGFDNIVLLRSCNNTGYARGNNMAFDYLKTMSFDGYVVVLNPDIEILDWSFFDKAIALSQNDDSIALSAPLMEHNGQVAQNALKKLPSLIDDFLAPLPMLNVIRAAVLSEKIVETEFIEAEMLPGSFLMGSFATWKRLGFFNENTFLFGEERILGKRIQDLGLRNLVFTRYRYNHADSRTLNRYYDAVRKFELHLKGRLVYIREYSSNSWIYSLFSVYYKVAISVRKVFV